MFYPENYTKRIKANAFIRFIKLNCARKKSLNSKIVNFFFNVVVLSVEDLKPSFTKSCLKQIYSKYELIFIFVKFGHFVLNETNNNFKMNSKKFFVNSKSLSEFLIYYKYFLSIIFENKKQFSFLDKLKSVLYRNYLLYSVFYFLDFYLIEKAKLKLKEKKLDNKVIYSVPVLQNPMSCIFYYRYFIYNSFKFNSLKRRPKEDVPLYLFCSNRVNFSYLDDKEFSKLLSSIRKFFRKFNKKQKAYSVLNELVKKAVPVSKIIYQRRGRIFIPLTNVIYNQNIRTSLGIKQIYMQSHQLANLPKKRNSFNFKLFISLLDILMSNNFRYQSEISTEVRKEAHNKGYFLKTFKARYRNF